MEIWDQFLSEEKRERRLADKTVREVLAEYSVWLIRDSEGFHSFRPGWKGWFELPD